MPAIAGSIVLKKGKEQMADCVVQTGNSGGLNVRAARSKKSRKLGVLANGTVVNVVRCDSTWATFMYRDTPAFVQLRYLADPPGRDGEGLASGDEATCNADRVAIRDAADGKESGRYLERDQSVTVYAVALVDDGYWYSIGEGQWVFGGYLAPDDERAQTEAPCTIQAVVDTRKHGTGGALNLRAAASRRARVVASIPNGATVCVESLTGTWLAARYGAYTGYVMAEFIEGSEAYGPDSGSDDAHKPGGEEQPDGEPGTGGTPEEPKPPESSGEAGGSAILYVFSAEQAVEYAMNHSDNSRSGPCPLRNRTFRSSDGKNDCADFVHQCICAGGVPMFDGWFYRLSGIPSDWSGSKWNMTYSGMNKLKGKGWIHPVPYDEVQPGDMIYTYKKDAKPTPYTHVTLAVSANVTENGKFGCRVCGYTANQHNAFKPLTPNNCECYRVYPAFTGDGTEKKVYLPLTGSGGYVVEARADEEEDT